MLLMRSNRVQHERYVQPFAPPDVRQAILAEPSFGSHQRQIAVNHWRDAGTDSPLASMSVTTSATTFWMPLSAASGVLTSQLRDGNSAHKPTCSPSSGDQVTR